MYIYVSTIQTEKSISYSVSLNFYYTNQLTYLFYEWMYSKEVECPSNTVCLLWQNRQRESQEEMWEEVVSKPSSQKVFFVPKLNQPGLLSI